MIKSIINTQKQKKETKVGFSTYVDEEFVRLDSKRTPAQTQRWPLVQEKMRMR